MTGHFFSINVTQKKANLLNGLQLFVASITDSNVEFKAHDRNIDSIHRTFITNGLATMTAMMLTDTCKHNSQN